MTKDILKRYDIEKLVIAFYEKLKADKQLGFHFNDAAFNKKSFLKSMYSFWENVIFYTGNYDGHPMEIHRSLHQQQALSKTLFKKWLELFCMAVDELYSGPNADTIKQKANSIAVVMQVKILG